MISGLVSGRVKVEAPSSPEEFLPEIFFVVFSQFPHDDAAECRVVDEPVAFDLIDQVLKSKSSISVIQNKL
jgi:hypothetical protein